MLVGVERLLEDRLFLAPSTPDLVKEALLISHVLLRLASVRWLVLRGFRNQRSGTGIRRRTCNAFESVCMKVVY